MATSDAESLDRDGVRRAIEREVAATTAEEYSTALAALERRGEVTAEQRRVVATMCAGIADGVLEPVRRTLEGADEDEQAALRTAVELFDPEGPERE